MLLPTSSRIPLDPFADGNLSISATSEGIGRTFFYTFCSPAAALSERNRHAISTAAIFGHRACWTVPFRRTCAGTWFHPGTIERRVETEVRRGDQRPRKRPLLDSVYARRRRTTQAVG